MKKSDTSICAAGSAGSHSPQAGPEPQQVEMFAPLPSPKSTPSAKPSSDITGPECPSSPTSETLTTKGDATSSLRDTPASPFPLPGSRKARQMTVTSGRTCLKSLSAKDPLGAFLKTLVVTSRWASTKCYLTWKTKATPQGRLLFQLAVKMPRTDVTESGLLHTPTATANQMAPSMRDRDRGSWWATPMADGTGGPNKLDEKGRRVSQTNPDLVFGANLADQVRMWPTPRAGKVTDEKEETWRKRQRKGDVSTPPLSLAVKMWPTPDVRGFTNEGSLNMLKAAAKDRDEWSAMAYRAGKGRKEKMWPTPSSRDGKGGYQGGRIRNGKISWDVLDVAVQHTDNQEKTGGQLNPKWVAWLQGYPTGWLSSVPWETQSSRKSRRK